MIKKNTAITLPILMALFCTSVYADKATNCAVEVAVATPPVQANENVAFNITNGLGVNRSVTLSKENEPTMLDNLPCSDMPYKITATYYSHQIDAFTSGAVGRCQLKAGTIILAMPHSNVSVVFPYDFICE